MQQNIRNTTFTTRTYLVWRKEIAISEITNTNMWQTAFGKVHEYIQKNNVHPAGPGTALYFSWDEAAGKTELGIGNPVEGINEVYASDLSLAHVSESEAVQLTVMGDYSRLREAHGAVMAHLEKHNLMPTLAIEEYTVMGVDKPDPKDWETNLYYLHE